MPGSRAMRIESRKGILSRKSSVNKNSFYKQKAKDVLPNKLYGNGGAGSYFNKNSGIANSGLPGIGSGGGNNPALGSGGPGAEKKSALGNRTKPGMPPGLGNYGGGPIGSLKYGSGIGGMGGIGGLSSGIGGGIGGGINAGMGSDPYNNIY